MTLLRRYSGYGVPLPVHAQAKIRPSKVIVVGTGVAGLAAIQQAKNMNALVRTQSEAQ